MFSINQKVKVKYEGKWCVGTIENITKTAVKVYIFEEFASCYFIKSDIVPLPEIYLSEADFDELACYKKTVFDFVGADGFSESINFKDTYKITLSHLICVLDRIKKDKKKSKDFFNEWFCHFDAVFRDFANVDNNEIYSENDVIYNILSEFKYWTNSNSKINVDALKDEANNFINDKDKPLSERNYPDYIKRKILRRYDSTSAMNNASEEELTLYIKFANELCDAGDKEGLLTVGYGCYGGNRAFKCDWEKSRDCIQKLFDTIDIMPDRAIYANTLGYIYYYGRCNNDIPQYEQAFKYFSFAAFAGIYEAQYKIADMYKNGYGVVKCTELSNEIIWNLYAENKKHIINGNFNCKFADVALRVGNIFRDDEYEQDTNEMLYYYTQADFAIRMRMNISNNYGDNKVCSAIQNALSETKELLDFKPSEKVVYYGLGGIFDDILSNGKKLALEIQRSNNKDYTMTFKPLDGSKMFITIPHLEMCGMYESLDVTLKGATDINNDILNERLIIDRIDYYNVFIHDEECLLELKDCRFEINAPKKNEEKVYKIASVEFCDGGKLYDYLCGDDIMENDLVTISVNDEEKTVRVIRIQEKKESELALPVSRYKILEK